MPEEKGDDDVDVVGGSDLAGKFVANAGLAWPVDKNGIRRERNFRSRSRGTEPRLAYFTEFASARDKMIISNDGFSADLRDGIRELDAASQAACLWQSANRAFDELADVPGDGSVNLF